MTTTKQGGFMYKIIMAPNDGSPNAYTALMRAARLAKHYDSELRIVRVSTPTLLIARFNDAVDPQVQQDTIDSQLAEDMRDLELLVRKCKRTGATMVSTVLLEGLPGPVLKDYAKQAGVDLIVISSHSRGDVGRLILGSVADFLIRNTEIPVLIVKKLNAIVGPDETVLTRILVPLDGSSHAEEVLPQAAAMATSPFTTVNLLQVLTPSTYSQEKIMDASLPWWENRFIESDNYLEHAASYLRHGGLAVVTDVILSNDVAGAILKHAEQFRVDMIAVTSSGTGGIKRMLFGSIADEVVRNSPVSVLVYHPGVPKVPRISHELAGVSACAVQ